MRSFMAFPICSLVFIIIVSIVYFGKPRIKSIENSIYKWLVISNIIGLILEISCYFAVDLVSKYHLISLLILKLYVVYIFVWSIIFNMYVLVVSHNNYNKNDKSLDSYFKKIKNKTILGSLITSVIMLLLPIEIFNDGKSAYTYGPITNLLLILCFSIVMTWIFKCVIHFRDLKQKRYIPVISCVIILTTVLLIQSYDRAILIATTGHSLIILLMYFTIENPDVKILEELSNNRKLVVKTLEEKSNFLFMSSKQIKKPIKDILNISKETLKSDDINRLKDNVREISDLTHSIALVVDNLNNENILNVKNIKVINNRYSIYSLITKIKLLKEKEIPKDIEFRVNINKNIPKYLYGDSKLLEQVILSILDNSIKYTKNGFIEININTIEKYDMCRLMITIEDTGIGMGIDRVNKLLMADENFTQKEFNDLETKIVNINTVKKIISKMGGYFTIKSQENKGTEVKIVVDQKIFDESSINLGE